MLQFILGRASSGKTYMVTQKIAECISQGENPVLLVPEQFSFESEKNILNALGDGNAQKVSVVSFTRLCDEIERVAGGVCGETLTDSDRIILMIRAIKLCCDQLKSFKKYKASKSFARLMLDTISEFKTNFISAQDLYNAVDSTGDPQLKLKLLDTALIYENYDLILAEKFIDNTDRLTKLYYALENHKYFNNKTVFIDSFKGFSGQQYKILERIMSQAKTVTVTLVDNPNDTREIGIFSNIKRVKNRISAIAKNFGKTVCNDIILESKYYACDELNALEDFMATGKTNFCGNAQNITICQADSVYSEADFVARNIRRIVRETGARFSDFVIIARNTEPYEDALETACKKNDIGCFIDKRIPLINLPTAVAVLSASNTAKSFSTENILRFHKSGLDILNVDEISTLENYAYLWNIDGAMWQNEWTMDPDGFVAAEELSDEKKEKLAKINELRQKAINPLLTFKENFKHNAKTMAAALVKLLDSVDAAQHFKNLSKQYDTPTYSDAIKQSWDVVMQVLNSLCQCLGESEISRSEFCDALRLALSFETVGIIPQMVDEAIFGAANRIRPSRPKYAFIMGANQGLFPLLQQGGGLFAKSERQKLIEIGLDIPDNTFSLAVDEECLLYSNICCATHGVCISYSTVVDGAEAQPSSFVVDIQKKFNCKVFKEPSNLCEDYLPESMDDAFSLLCNKLYTDFDDAKTLAKSLENSEYNAKISAISQIRNRCEYSISNETAHKLFGKKITMSPSKFDTFNRCRFMYFCRYGLRVERLQPAEFNAMQRGTVVHYVLQRVIEDYGKNVSQLQQSKISDLVDKYINEYLNMVAGYADIETPYLKYLITTIKRTLRYVVKRLALEFAQSDFVPQKCELRIGGKNADMPYIEFPIDDSGVLELGGVIDRLDTWNGYIRIVDYKTGHRDFKLPDILFGQNMQMLIYLYAVVRNKKFGDKAAGILYMPASRDKNGVKSARRMNGLIVADSNLVYAMEKENEGEFVPKYSQKSPSDSFVQAKDFNKIFDFIESKLKRTGLAIYNGDIAATPVDSLDSGACKYCEYQNICQIGNEAHIKVPKLTNSQVMEEIERQVTEDGI